jgi:hypothetical protein
MNTSAAARSNTNSRAQPPTPPPATCTSPCGGAMGADLHAPYRPWTVARVWLYPMAQGLERLHLDRWLHILAHGVSPHERARGRRGRVSVHLRCGLLPGIPEWPACFRLRPGPRFLHAVHTPRAVPCVRGGEVAGGTECHRCAPRVLQVRLHGGVLCAHHIAGRVRRVLPRAQPAAANCV